MCEPFKANSAPSATLLSIDPKGTAQLIHDAADAPTEVSNRFAADVANITGESIRTTKRHVKIAKSFSEDELEVFEAQGLTGQQIEMISNEKDNLKRSEFVSLIASGLGFEESHKAIHGIKPDLSALSKEVKEGVRAAAKETAEEMTDDAWFEANCKEKSDLIKFPAQFFNAAILYRKIAVSRAKFRTAIKKELAAQKSNEKHHNPMWSLLNRVISLSHPKDWYLCDECQGSCMGDEADEQCPICFGSGFRLRTENYL
jgi:rubrerythrin